jgi:putative DNA primase/helicase
VELGAPTAVAVAATSFPASPSVACLAGPVAIDAGADGQVRRVAEKFALIAYAGKLACDWKLVPMEAKVMAGHISMTFEHWFRDRETAGSLEHVTAVRQIVHFLQTQGEHRFTEPTIDPDDGFEPKARKDRAGYILADNWLVFPGVYRDEMLRGQNPRAISQYLIEMGALIPGSDGKASQSLRINGKQQRFYVLTRSIMELAL